MRSLLSVTDASAGRGHNYFLLRVLRLEAPTGGGGEWEAPGAEGSLHWVSLEIKQGFFSEEIMRPCVFANPTMKEHFAIGLKDNLCT